MRFPTGLALAVASLGLVVDLGSAAAQDLEIFQIQGSGMSSPVEGQEVTTTANVVTAVGSEGFFIQTPDDRDDGNPQTSNGIYVAAVSPEADVGFMVNVTGRVVELFGWTQLHDVEVSVEDSGQPLPQQVELDGTTPSPLQPWPENELERFEGMRVRVANGVIAAPTDGFGDACVVATPERPFREPGIQYPGLPGLPIFDGNPEAFRIAPGGLGGQAVSLVAGATFSAEGVLAFEFDEYRLWPTELVVSDVPVVPRPVRARRSGEVTIATQNVERLGFEETQPPIAVRLAKLSGQIREVLGAPDVVSLQEVQDLEVLTALADRVTADDPSLRYTPIHRQAPWEDGFDVAFLVRDTLQVESVTQVGANAIFGYDGSLLNDRPPLVLEVLRPGTEPPFTFTVVSVHQRSLNGIDDPGGGGERVRRKRHEQAVWLARWLQQRQVARPDERLIVAGDFNAFEFTDGWVDVMGQVTGRPDPRGASIAVVPELDPPFANQTWSLPSEERYTYVYSCDAEVLDHFITSSAVDPWVSGVEVTRGNADAPEPWQNDPDTAARSSDHDGAVLYLGPRWRRPAGRRYAP
jgi:predicted extracellular nuclease